MRISSLQLSLEDAADESTVRAALQAGKAERKRAGRRAPGEKLKPEEVFAIQAKNAGLPTPAAQSQFALKIGRRWSFDFCWYEQKIAVEIEGLVVRRINGELRVTGRHASVTGFNEDCEKYACAALLGWTVVRFTPKQVDSRYAVDMTARILEARGWKRPAMPAAPF